MVSERGILDYLASYWHSMFKADSVNAFSLNDKINVAPVDKYDVPLRAKHCVELGDFESEIRLMNVVECDAARDCQADTKRYLETRSLDQLLIAHALVASI